MSCEGCQTNPLDEFVRPMLGLPAWGVRQGYASSLDFNFGQPRLIVREYLSKRRGTQRNARAQGQWLLWIDCCNWRVLQQDTQLAWSEDDRGTIERATATLNGQMLLAIDVEPQTACCVFRFDLGGALETWPYENKDADLNKNVDVDDKKYEEWMIFTESEAFAFRDDGSYSRGPLDTPNDEEKWLPLA